ncbi:hypothetical protein [Dactylosporangium matsuzakiense]|uniref:Uncharacterized protein n=1 Tax=Dactylosporangium matsuzakiense TaxID=53360 RepID=A0A9W6NPL4_9ACTN|nr:hypothetical protein [Dactylosporangium matsuzakiense]UWZ46911.1 hypothetical protein Dmats_11135 [Dactylosporangium matsuzakiense]GLL04197.1 hypothetical protein GCM10017581_059440 [Dactylosporangium matsuzakiense]
MPCPRCGATGVDPAGYCVQCRLFRGPASPPPQAFYPVPPPPKQRNPLLIPGIVFGVVALLLAAGVIVYAVVGGDSPAADQGLTGGTNPVVAPSLTAAPDDPTPTPTATVTATPGASASGSAGASPTAGPSCVVGVFLEEQHTEQVTVLNTGTFPFSGSGAYHRYTDSGRVTLDYGDGMSLRGSNGANQYEYIFAGYISYTYKYENGVLTFSSPRPDPQGTETFIRNGNVDFKGKLEARVPPPMKVNCGGVAMSLSNQITTIQLRRTSKAP